jgi:hypothetical protein
MNYNNAARFAVATAIAIAICTFTYSSISPVLAADDFKVGDQVEATVSGLLTVESSYEPCVVTEVISTGYRLKCSGIEYVVQKAWVRPGRNAAAAQPAAAPEKPREPAIEQNDKQVECDFAPPGPSVVNTARFSADVARRKLYDNYQIGVRVGGVTSPLRVGVTFETVKIAGSFVNTVDVFGQRINDAAPAGATIYKVNSKHIVCEEYRNDTLRRQVESNYACFKNRDAEWACGLDGMPKITQLKN